LEEKGEVSVGFYSRSFFKKLGAGLTKFVISHEFKHLEEYMKIGHKEYLKGIDGSLADKQIRTYKRERYVFDELIKKRHLLNKEEIKDAIRYINSVIKDGKTILVVKNGKTIPLDFFEKIDLIE
jgi:hypothetical protein